MSTINRRSNVNDSCSNRKTWKNIRKFQIWTKSARNVFDFNFNYFSKKKQDCLNSTVSRRHFVRFLKQSQDRRDEQEQLKIDNLKVLLKFSQSKIEELDKSSFQRKKELRKNNIRKQAKYFRFRFIFRKYKSEFELNKKIETKSIFVWHEKKI